MVHSTGHKTRLDRQLAPRQYGKTEEYSKEELTAEIGAAILLNQIGIETSKTFTNSAAYIQSWLKVLKSDNKFIISVAGRAERQNLVIICSIVVLAEKKDMQIQLHLFERARASVASSRYSISWT